MVKCPGNREMHKSTERDTEKHMLAVMKFGGSSVADLDKIRNVAEQCIKKCREGNQVVVGLSAMGKTTDHLLSQAAHISSMPSR